MRNVICAAAFAALFAVPVSAEDTPATSQPVSTQQYTITLSGLEWQEIAASVQRSDVISARQAGDIMTKIGQQIQAQTKKQTR